MKNVVLAILSILVILFVSGCVSLEPSEAAQANEHDSAAAEEASPATDTTEEDDEAPVRITIEQPVTCGECQYEANGVCKNSVCCSASDCDDQNNYTSNSCGSPGTANASCSNRPSYDCTVDIECDDGDVTTQDICKPLIDQPNATNYIWNCTNIPIPECGIDNDDFCPTDCSYADDTDCAECQSHDDCDDNDASTLDTCGSSPLQCSHAPITDCYSDDNYCPSSCTNDTDTDCSTDAVPDPEDTPPVDVAPIRDCGGDIDCFIESSQTCEKVKLSYPFTFFGTTTTSYYELQGLVNEKCKYYQRFDEYENGLLDPEQLAAARESTVGVSYTCRYETTDLVELMTLTKNGSVDSEVSGKGNCCVALAGETCDWAEPTAEELNSCIVDSNCNEGFECAQGQCTAESVLESKEDCDESSACSQPCENCDDGQYGCMLSGQNLEIKKCVECFTQFGCADGYKCSAYECVPE